MLSRDDDSESEEEDEHGEKRRRWGESEILIWQSLCFVLVFVTYLTWSQAIVNG